MVVDDVGLSARLGDQEQPLVKNSKIHKRNVFPHAKDHWYHVSRRRL